MASVVLRVFPRRTSMTPTDSMAFVGYPPLWRPEADEVHVSVTFSWDKELAEPLRLAWQQHYPRVVVGGPAFNGEGDGFAAGMYLRDGVTITSRGCPYNCPWCLVKGTIRLLEIEPGYIIQDNNLLATGKKHMSKVFAMLRAQKHAAVFSGGLDARLVTPWVAEELRGLRIEQAFLAADTDGALCTVEKAIQRLSYLSRDKLRCYVLLGFASESLEAGEDRCREVWEMGAMPFAQLFQPPEMFVEYPIEWRQAARRWQRPAIMKARYGKQRLG